MASSRTRVPIDEWTADKWFREFFSECRLPGDDAESYAVIFAQNGMRSDMLPLLNKDLLKEMKINKVGHIIEILRAAQEVSSQEQRLVIKNPPKSLVSTASSKVVSLKSVVNTKDSRQRKESEVGGVKRDLGGVKRSVPDEHTLSVKMPNQRRQPPSNSQEEGNQIVVRPPVKERTSAQSVEVSSSSEKKKKSVFERLGTTSTPQTRPEGSSLAIQTSPPGGILKKNPSNPDLKPAAYYGPAELPRSTIPEEPKRNQSFGRLVLNNSGNRSIQPNSPQTPRGNRSSSPFRQRSQSPGPSSSKPTMEPSFHVTMSMKLTNPLVSKVANGPLNKKQQERRNLSTSFSSYSRGVNTPQSEKQHYGSMAADQIEMYKDVGTEKDLKQRLGNKGSPWNKMEGLEKKRVSFGNVRTKEIPALPFTQPLNPNQTTLCKQIYTGSVALRTFKKL